MSVAFEVIEAVIGMGCIIIILFVLFGVLKWYKEKWKA
jgi:hypothetical protein